MTFFGGALYRRRLQSTAKVAGTAVALALVAFASPRAGAAPGIDVFEARAEAGGIHDSVAVPAYFETFLPYSLDEASNGSAHGYHSTFYGGFFLTAAAGQYGAPNPPGTTETLYPQGPTTASASTIPFPGAEMGSSHGTSSATGSDGAATFGGGGFGPQGSLAFGQTATSVKVGSVVRSSATVVMQDLHLGPLAIGAVHASAEAVSGASPGTGKTTSSLTFAGATVNGAPIADLATLGQASPLDAVLAQAGLTITRLPDTRAVNKDGTDSRIEIGGVKVTFAQPAQEFTVTWTLGRVQARSRALPALDAAAARVATPQCCEPTGAPDSEAITPPNPSESGPLSSLGSGVAPDTSGTAAGAVTRRIVRTTRARGMDVSTLAGLIALAAIFGSLARRAFRAAASP
jgi:hypothetical protein